MVRQGCFFLIWKKLPDTILRRERDAIAAAEGDGRGARRGGDAQQKHIMSLHFITTFLFMFEYCASESTDLFYFFLEL